MAKRPQKVGSYRAYTNQYMVTVPSTFSLVFVIAIFHTQNTWKGYSVGILFFLSVWFQSYSVVIPLSFYGYSTSNWLKLVSYNNLSTCSDFIDPTWSFSK